MTEKTLITKIVNHIEDKLDNMDLKHINEDSMRSCLQKTFIQNLEFRFNPPKELAVKKHETNWK